MFALVVLVVCVGHADNDDSCHHLVKRTTRGSCADWQNIGVYIHPAPIVVINALATIIVFVG